LPDQSPVDLEAILIESLRSRGGFVAVFRTSTARRRAECIWCENVVLLRLEIRGAALSKSRFPLPRPASVRDTSMVTVT